MIARLTGTCAYVEDDTVVIDVAGVGYLVKATTDVVRAAMTAAPDAALSVFVHTNVREDAIQLFAFSSLAQQRLFERLLTLQGVGPRVAMSIVSAYGPADIRRAAQSEDLALLQSIPGIGPKVARRIVTELRDKLDDIAPAFTTLGADAPEPATATFYDARAALVELGLSVQNAEAALRETDDDASADERVRQALQAVRA
jgi:Holliday junction DNA helicase RuvA